MDRLPLSLKLSDANKLQAKSEILPLVFGAIPVLYFLNTPLDTVIFHIIPAFIVFHVVVLFIICNGTSVALTKNGISYLNWHGRYVLCSWDSPIEISKSPSARKDFYAIKYLEKNKVIHVNKIVFSYPEVAKFISENSPLGHKLRELVANGS